MMMMMMMKTAVGLVVAATSVASLATADVTPENKKSTRCCYALSENPALQNKVYYPDSTTYDARIASYWSKSAALEPWCMVLPSTAEDASEVIKVITANECPFGIRAGGHSVFPLSSSVEDGITIDFDCLHRARRQLGCCLRCVGVGGFILGGGNSFFNGAYGFACDMVKNSEIVLADGSIVNANARENRNLCIALKGDSGNFGLVTRFDMHTIPYADPKNPVIWGGGLVWDVNATDGVIDALVEFGNNVADDVDSSSYCGLSWDPRRPQGGLMTFCSLNNIRNKPSAPAFDRYMAVDGIIGSTLQSDTMLNLTRELDGGAGLYNVWFTRAFKNDPRVMRFAVERHNEFVQRLQETMLENEAQNSMLQFQPITKPMVSQGKGLKSLGLEDEIAGGPGILFAVILQMSTPASEAAVYPIAMEFQKTVDEYAASIGARWEWRYLNYADLSIDPIARYGKKSVERMRDVSAKYDPKAVFQKLRKSGHKIPT
ncbi:hypothetical protein AJ80_01491 [Polytolypa hystricis UAMH7299]|uniref:FAD-binding PCMH-type domain-containing protein n=1 Tax=Polytolypa hystricis (strain UAMH7299) TaxID=1447883 RepID=A0A2B7Z1A6_POLH7|nr:hypothetical protein AJ80_01491 [Polytolypa hystricis UAMH7299]